MAYSPWLQPNKTSGNGNDTITVQAVQQNTGRNARQTTLTFKAADCDDVLRTILQKGKAETSSIQDTATVIKAGGKVTISGVSNSQRLTFSLGTGDLNIVLPEKYTVNGMPVDNDTDIAGDPGATAEYDFSIQLTVDANLTLDPMSRQIIVTDAAGTPHVCTLTIAAGDAYLRVSPETVELPWDGSTSASFNVESNTNWQIV